MFVGTGLTRRELEAAGRKVVRRDGKQILLLVLGDLIFAIANRCPHEGYPLSEGTDGPGCVLTCNWHNWKFDLRTGNALIGRDPVRVYPIELRGSEIFVDTADPPAEAQRVRALHGLDVAIADGDNARIARETARLERAGFDARDSLVHAIRTTVDRFENGTSHAHAAAADWLVLAERAPSSEARLAAVLEPVAHIAWDISGAATFPYAGAPERWDAKAFVAAVEKEDEPRALSLIRGAIAAHLPYAQLRPALGAAALAHYADFGHSAIYTLKNGQLIDRLGPEVAEPVLLGLTRSLVQAFREDLLPEFRGYAPALEAWNDAGQESVHAEDYRGLSPKQAMARALASAGRPVREQLDALLGAAAWNLLNFDLSFDRATGNAIADNVSWLDFTHALTFANAARHICEENPDLWPNALLQLSLFVGRNAGYVARSNEAESWSVGDTHAFIAAEMATLYDHGIVEPIIACHRVKVLFALEDEISAAPDAPWISPMTSAVHRYLDTPQKRHHSLRLATQARDFIAQEG